MTLKYSPNKKKTILMIRIIFYLIMFPEIINFYYHTPFINFRHLFNNYDSASSLTLMTTMTIIFICPQIQSIQFSMVFLLVKLLLLLLIFQNN